MYLVLMANGIQAARQDTDFIDIAIKKGGPPFLFLYQPPKRVEGWDKSSFGYM